MHKSKELAVASGDAGLNILEIAKALGLKTELMTAFRLEGVAGEPIEVTVKYFCENGEMETVTGYIKEAMAVAPTNPQLPS
jgi:hypothetical protein